MGSSRLTNCWVAHVPEHGGYDHNGHDDVQHQKQFVLLPPQPEYGAGYQSAHGDGGLRMSASESSEVELRVFASSQSHRRPRTCSSTRTQSRTSRHLLSRQHQGVGREARGRARPTLKNKYRISDGVDHGLQRSHPSHPSMESVVGSKVPAGEPNRHVVPRAEQPDDRKVGKGNVARPVGHIFQNLLRLGRKTAASSGADTSRGTHIILTTSLQARSCTRTR